MRKEPVDFEELFFTLKENPMVRSRYRSLKHGDKPRTPEQMERSVVMNLKWADKLLKHMIIQSYTTAMILKRKTNEGLTAWM